MHSEKTYEPYVVHAPTRGGMNLGQTQDTMSHAQMADRLEALLSRADLPLSGELVDMPLDGKLRAALRAVFGDRHGNVDAPNAPARRVVPILHDNPSDRFGSPLTNDGLLHAGDEAHVRLVRVMPELGALAPTPPISADVVHSRRLDFAEKPTNGMVYAAPTREGVWQVQPLPYGQTLTNPWQNVYGGGDFGRMVCWRFEGREDGENGIYGFRIDKHIKRISDNAGVDGFGDLDPEMLLDMLKLQAEYDRDLIPMAENPHGNRGYLHLGVRSSARGPGLKGEPRERMMRCMLLPVGPYLTDGAALDVSVIPQRRPVMRGDIKSEMNYHTAVQVAAEYEASLRAAGAIPATMPLHESLFVDQQSKAGGGRPQEFRAMNLVLFFRGKGRDGRTLVIRPSMARRDILNGVVAQSFAEIAADAGFDVRDDLDLSLAEACDADALVACGTAANGRPINTMVALPSFIREAGLASKADGAVLYRHNPQRAEASGLNTVLERYHRCLARAPGAPFPEWMQKLCA